MKTHNRVLYHCLCCGNVVHAEPADPNPSCCREPMARAAAETVWEREEECAAVEAAGNADEPSPAARPERVPR